MDDVAVELRPGRQAVADGTRAQQRKARKDSWTRAQEVEFLEVLSTTCNVSEAARVAGVRRAGAYERRQRDARFDIGYAEIEAMLMREVLFGSESEEIVLDGEGAVKSRKVKRGRDLKLALQLLIRHRDKVAAYRAAAGVQRPDSPDAVARLRRAMDEIARKRAATGT